MITLIMTIISIMKPEYPFPNSSYYLPWRSNDKPRREGERKLGGGGKLSNQVQVRGVKRGRQNDVKEEECKRLPVQQFIILNKKNVEEG